MSVLPPLIRYRQDDRAGQPCPLCPRGSTAQTPDGYVECEYVAADQCTYSVFSGYVLDAAAAAAA